MERDAVASAERTNSDFTELYARDLTGRTLSPGLYKWGTGASLNGRVLAQTAVTLDANAVTMPISLGTVNTNVSLQRNMFTQNHADNTMEFTIPSSGMTTLRIMNIQGREIGMLFRGDAQAGKQYRVRHNSAGLAKGLYLSRLEVNEQTSLKKIVPVQ